MPDMERILVPLGDYNQVNLGPTVKPAEVDHLRELIYAAHTNDDAKFMTHAEVPLSLISRLLHTIVCGYPANTETQTQEQAIAEFIFRLKSTTLTYAEGMFIVDIVRGRIRDPDAGLTR